MSDVAMLAKFMEGLAASGPLAVTLGVGVLMLWRKAEAERAANAALTREVLTALSSNTEALNGLRDALGQDDRWPARRVAGAD